MRTKLMMIMLIIVTLSVSVSYAQGIKVHLKDGNVESYPYSKIDSIVAYDFRTTNVVNGHEFVDLGLSVRWATCNIGATKPEDYGNYYAWGETEPKNTYTWGNYKYANGASNKLTKYCGSSSYGNNGYSDSKTILDAEDDAATVNWGGPWRIPTEEECRELVNKCTLTWTTQDGVNGLKVVGPNGNSIFLPSAGCYDPSAGKFVNISKRGYYWSSSLYGSDSREAKDMGFDSKVSKYTIVWAADRAYGFTIRAVVE